jgi:hypothetical protein
MATSSVDHSAKKEGIGLLEVLDRVTMQFFVRDYCTMITAPVQRDVDGISKGSHFVRVPLTVQRRKPCTLPLARFSKLATV